MVDWPKIVERHGPTLWRSVNRLVGNEADAADCFQNVLLSALQVARRVDVKNWAGLLQRLATVESIELLRRRYRHGRKRCPLTSDDQLDCRNPSPDLAARTGELVEDLREALTKLDQRQAEVFCLACLEGQSYQQIADQLNLNRNYVGVLLNRARAKLRDELAAHASKPVGKILNQGKQS